MKIALAERPELEEDNEILKTLAYQKFIDQINEDYKIEINPNEIIGKFHFMFLIKSINYI